jgi:hypothetical protein
MAADIPAQQRLDGIPLQQRSAKGKWVEDIVMGNIEDDFNVVEVIRTEKVPPMWTKPRDQLQTQQPSHVIYADSTRTSGENFPFLIQ